MRPHDDAVIAVFRRTNDHLLIPLRRQQGEHKRTHVSVCRVPAREGWAVDQVHDRAAVIDIIAGRNIEVVRPHNRQDRGFGLKRPGVPVLVGARRPARSAIGDAERIRRPVDIREDSQSLVGNRLLAVCRAVGEEIFAGVRIRSRRRVGVSDDLVDGLGDAGESLPIEIMRARLIGRPERRAQAVRQLGQIAVGDKGVAKRLLLLFGERQQGGLPYDSSLDSAGDGVVGGQRGPAVRAARQGGDRGQASESGHVGRALRVGRDDAHRQARQGLSRILLCSSRRSSSTASHRIVDPFFCIAMTASSNDLGDRRGLDVPASWRPVERNLSARQAASL